MANAEGVQRAFRAGLYGHPYPYGQQRGLAEPQAPFAHGPNEQAILATRRLPGLVDPVIAYETGKLLRYIARLFDRAGAPETVGRQFRDNLQTAILTHAMRRSGRAWRVEDSVDMFLELYRRVLGEREEELDRLRERLLREARRHGSEKRQRW